MLKKLTLPLAVALVCLVSLAPSAKANTDLYLAEEVEQFYTLDGKFIKADTGVTANGTLLVAGERSQFQVFNRVKALRCTIKGAPLNKEVASRYACTEAKFFGLNEVKTLPEGLYAIGFENSIYPGFVRVSANKQTKIDLAKIALPADGSVKVYRNLTSALEQKKMYFSQLILGRAMFSLAAYSFGDLYLRKFPLQDLMPNIEYSFCDQPMVGEMTPKASQLCQAWKVGKISSMKDFFAFASDSTHAQFIPREPGDAFKYSFTRLLVAAPASGSGSFVNVLPGDYIIEQTVGGKVVSKSISVKGTANFGVE